MAAEQNNLWAKCMDGKLEEVRLALQAGADPNTRGGSDNWTCLMVAIWKNYEELVDLLLAQPGIEVNAEDQNKDTALYYTCAKIAFSATSHVFCMYDQKLHL